jgi:hypothetical protein
LHRSTHSCGGGYGGSQTEQCGVISDGSPSALFSPRGNSPSGTDRIDAFCATECFSGKIMDDKPEFGLLTVRVKSAEPVICNCVTSSGCTEVSTGLPEGVIS